MAEPFLGMILPFPYTYAPRNWAFCQGQSISMQQNPSLFSLLNDTFGGDMRSYFLLPDLRGRVPMGAGTGPGLSQYSLGQKVGVEKVTLDVSQMPVHGHQATFTPSGGGSGTPLSVSVSVSSDTGGQSAPDANYKYLAPLTTGSPDPVNMWAKNLSSPVTLGGVTVSGGGGIIGGTVAIANSGGSQSVAIRNPALALNFCIALDGLYPARS